MFILDPKPGVSILSVKHDAWCPILKKGSKHGPCKCNPQMELISPDKVDAYLKSVDPKNMAGGPRN
jgi:hypothetical protein